MTSILTFCNNLNNAPEYIDCSGYFVFYDNLCSSNFYNSFFCAFIPKVEKLNISAIYKSIIIIFSVYLPLVYIYKFIWKKLKSNHQETWEHYIGPNYLEILQKNLFKIPCSNDPKYLKWKLSNFLKFLFYLKEKRKNSYVFKMRSKKKYCRCIILIYFIEIINK